ncbi:hypothetical protein [Actinoplanes sp. G11-F43]|uniref:hypothetical protein n=1 Tax=Actinoplanes sp. G11-F43 TaxID=3424130 RepID=UPI003D33B229
MPAQKTRRWFITALIAMVILGVAAGLALSRARGTTGALRDVTTTRAGAGSTPGGAGTTPPGIDAAWNGTAGPGGSGQAGASGGPGAHGEDGGPGQAGANGTGERAAASADVIPVSVAPSPARPRSEKSGKTKAGSGKLAPNDPVIAVFRVTREPACPSGTHQTRTEGNPVTDRARNENRPVTLEWKVTGADEVTLSVDGPDIHASYRATDTATIDFPCGDETGGGETGGGETGGAETGGGKTSGGKTGGGRQMGSEQTHTYTLTVPGPNGTESKTLTVTARLDDPATA